MGHGRSRPTPNFCEVCGVRCPPMRSLGGWLCCSAHLPAAKPDRPVFDHRTGERLAPGAEDPVAWRRELDAIREVVTPIDHLDLELSPDDVAALAALDQAVAERARERRELEQLAERSITETAGGAGDRWLRRSAPDGSPDPTRDEQTDSDGYLF